MSLVSEVVILTVVVKCDGCSNRLTITTPCEMDAQSIAHARFQIDGKLQNHQLENPMTGQRWLSKQGSHWCSVCRKTIERAQELGA